MLGSDYPKCKRKRDAGISTTCKVRRWAVYRSYNGVDVGDRGFSDAFQFEASHNFVNSIGQGSLEIMKNELLFSKNSTHFYSMIFAFILLL